MQPAIRRAQIVVEGAVQGVGFRPFIYRLAEEMRLPGWVSNTPQGVVIEVEGASPQLDEFARRIELEKPPHACIQSLRRSDCDPTGYTGFEIRASSSVGKRTALLLPDLATCEECRVELFDPQNRRFLYPFTNCTHCGPRFSIIESLPYDRPNTSMKIFPMCSECRTEYENPLDRRFHAQPNACPICGPHLEFWDEAGKIVACYHEALRAAAQAIREGRIVAVKGLGGFHLMADVRNGDAIIRLRQRKHREEKPFALMFPDLEAIEAECRVSKLEASLLKSPQSPIVLLERIDSAVGGRRSPLDCIAPDNPYLGAMLPYTPLHSILLRELKAPVIATSGNRSDEPICIDEQEALQRLAGIADCFLVHNRPIVRHVDDSIVRVMAGREAILRRARGYAPAPIDLGRPLPPILATGAHLKNTIALSAGTNVFISQHIGDLETEPAYRAFQEVIGSFQNVYETAPERAACDLHPDYLSSQFALNTGLPLIQVQHHYAHVLSCMAENRIEPPVLGVAWDGTGLGLDGTIWGGEFLRATPDGFQRAAHLRTFPLPSGDRAVKQPRRVALGLLYERFGDEAFALANLAPLRAFAESELRLLRDMLKRQINSPRTSSAGRLFDAVASLLDIRQELAFEGQAAMQLEFALPNRCGDDAYPFAIIPAGSESASMVVDWSPMLDALLADIRAGCAAAECSLRFHNGLADAIVAIARRVGEEKVALSGGCFQNRYLCERAIRRLREEGFQPFWHRLVPPNDGGISLGQIAAVLR